MLVRPLILSFIFIVVGVGKTVYTADNKTIQWHCIYARNGAKTPSDDERMRCYCCQYTNIISIVSTQCVRRYSSILVRQRKL